MVKRGLGRGLGALLPELKDKEGTSGVQLLPVDTIVAGKHQPREDFDREKLEELVNSIRAHGVIQPIVVRPLGEGRYELVAGERRWRACQLAGLREIPALVRQLDEREVREIALIENVQREDLNPLEEAKAYQALLVEYGLTQEEIASRVGKSRPVIANALRLLQLPLAVQEMLRQGQLSAGHARALLSLEDPELQVRAAAEVVNRKLSVRETEELVRRWQRKGVTGPGISAEKKRRQPDWELEAVTETLEARLGTTVKIRPLRQGGRIEIYYYSDGELERLLQLLGQEIGEREECFT
ncbi:chromosome partitioning protein, ParB family [Thermanaeromonas toyohensis ToBE]|uniref:Chromosome partitioning protein, ParB family n=1 Tax=Thermanaeromonas toyohensis ToBE TaxID=698762 RepID=A0A1W1W3I0_9FIRM|nr:ParB/RepB/Spo0J family partition protein [Thermanaeromonas toyohensis]SMC00185.1 chromosome partitioning protein, ParB family [Thermanaeromonas toyohensis ToBE]